MRPTTILKVTGLTAALMLAGCATDPESGITTASVKKPKPQRVATVDPTCTALTAMINSARQEGTPERVRTVAKGKGRMVTIKRSSLAKVAELDKLNAEYQMKCGKYPSLQNAGTLQPTTAAAAAPAAKARPVPTTLKKPAAVASKPIVAVPKQQ